jgi:hypothetical protein
MSLEKGTAERLTGCAKEILQSLEDRECSSDAESLLEDRAVVVLRR